MRVGKCLCIAITAIGVIPPTTPALADNTCSHEAVISGGPEQDEVTGVAVIACGETHTLGIEVCFEARTPPSTTWRAVLTCQSSSSGPGAFSWTEDPTETCTGAGSNPAEWRVKATYTIDSISGTPEASLNTATLNCGTT